MNTWQDRAFEHDMAVREKQHQQGLNSRAQVAAELGAKGFELLDEVDVVLHANESNAMRVVIGYVIQDRKGRKLFRNRTTNRNSHYDKKLVEQFQAKRLEELENR